MFDIPSVVGSTSGALLRELVEEERESKEACCRGVGLGEPLLVAP